VNYDPWGELRAVSGPSQTRYGYTGQRAEKGLGLYFYGARWYDPQLSRFLSADSIIPPQQGVQAWDRFAYVNNNPLKYTDPSGHQATDIGSGSSSGTGTGGTSSSQSTVDDDSSGLGLEDAGDGNPTIIELSPKAAAQLIDDLDEFLSFANIWDGGSLALGGAIEILGLFLKYQVTPEPIALFFDITIADAAAMLALANPICAIVGIGAFGVGITGLVTTNDLQNLRNGLADMDLDTLGGTVSFEWGLYWDTMTVESSKGSTSFPTENVGFATSYAPSFLFIWAAMHPELFGSWEY